MPVPIRFSDDVAWLSGAQSRLLAHAYPDRTRLVSLGLSVLAAAAWAGAASAVAAGLVAGPWAGALLLLPATATAGVAFRAGLAWAWRGQRLGRRLGLLAAGVGVLAFGLALPLTRALLGPPLAQPAATANTLTELRWAVRLVTLFVLLLPVYGVFAARHGSYARALATRRALDALPVA